MNLKIFLFLLITSSFLFAQPYPDQNYVLKIDSLYATIESSAGIRLSSDGKSIILQDGVTDGYFITLPRYSQNYFNEGLPSWNGTAPHQYSSAFKVQMRFPYGSGYSPWLTVGFWKNNIWSSYGQTSYSEGYIDYDNVKLNLYKNSWQFKVILTRSSAAIESPSVSKLNFYVSDSRTTAAANYTEILNDNPPQIFIPTTFVYQYGVDPTIGGSICSPTTVSMILKSYNIQVDPLQFALDTYDPYFEMFGIWPRVVQNASEYGTDGAVTRYRTWSEAYDVLSAGGRIGMSIGQPLYTGHLIMLAGFTSNGNPVVHDPAKSNGYSYIYNKGSLSHSWFDKGGVAYTIFPSDSAMVDAGNSENMPKEFVLYQNYPNPFNPATTIAFNLPYSGPVKVRVTDILGREISTLIDEEKSAGYYEVMFNSSSLPSGVYIYTIQTESFNESKKMMLLK